MKHKYQFTLLMCLVLTAFLATSAFTTSTPQDDKVVFGGNYVLTDNEILNGNLIALGATISLEQGSNVNGDAVLTARGIGISFGDE